MMETNFSPTSPGKSTIEIYLQERSTKKIKEIKLGKHGSKVPSSDGRSLSFRDIITGRNSEDMEEEQLDNQEEDVILEDMFGEVRVEEETIRGYECPSLVFSTEEEKRILRPWHIGVIFNLLGRRIGYKALRLNHMLVPKGVISNIDLSNHYCLVDFSHDDDGNDDDGNDKKPTMENRP